MSKVQRVTDKFEASMKYWALLFFVPTIIFFLLYFFIPHAKANPFISAELAVAFAGIILTVMGEARKGAIVINLGFMAFIVHYFLILSGFIGEPIGIILLWFFAFILVTMVLLINITFLGKKEKITQEFYEKWTKRGTVVVLADVLTMIVYSSYFWWFGGNLVSSSGLGLIALGLILPLFRNFIPSRKIRVLVPMNVINLGISFLIFGGLYSISADPYYSIFLAGWIGFFINLGMNLIAANMPDVLSDTIWSKLFFFDFLFISIFGSLFFGIFPLDLLQKSLLISIWFSSISFATIHFAYKADLITVESRDKLRILASLGISLEFTSYFSLLAYSFSNPLIAPFIALGTFSISIAIFMILFNLWFTKSLVYYFNAINLL